MFTNWFRYEISWAVALRNHKKTFAVRICDWVIKFMIHAAVIWKIKSTQSQRKSSKNVKSETRTVFGAKRLIEPITHSWYLDDAWWPIGSWNAMHGMTNQQHESRSGSENSWIEKIRVWLMRVISICRHFLLAANQLDSVHSCDDFWFNHLRTLQRHLQFLTFSSSTSSKHYIRRARFLDPILEHFSRQFR